MKYGIYNEVGEIDWRKVELVIYTKEIEERKKTIKYIPTSSVLLTFDPFATTYFALEGVQVWRIGSSTFAIYTTKRKDWQATACSSP